MKTKSHGLSDRTSDIILVVMCVIILLIVAWRSSGTCSATP